MLKIHAHCMIRCLQSQRPGMLMVELLIALTVVLGAVQLVAQWYGACVRWQHEALDRLHVITIVNSELDRLLVQPERSSLGEIVRDRVTISWAAQPAPDMVPMTLLNVNVVWHDRDDYEHALAFVHGIPS